MTCQTKQSSNTMNKRFMLERNKINSRGSDITKSYKISCLGIGTKEERIPFWKWERAVLMFRMYKGFIINWPLHPRISIKFINMLSFTAYIQRFWMQIMNSAVCVKIIISQKWVLLPSWEQNKIMLRWCILVCNKKLRMIMFGNWNKTRKYSFLEMGRSSSNVPNIFKGSLTGHLVRGYWE